MEATVSPCTSILALPMESLLEVEIISASIRASNPGLRSEETLTPSITDMMARILKSWEQLINQPKSCAIDSMKMIPGTRATLSLGHLLAGAPAVDAILGVHMVNDGMIPATFPPVSPDGNLNIGTVGEQPLKASIRRVMVNCRSFEGQCASLIIEGVG